MKNIKRGLSLLLVMVMLISSVAIGLGNESFKAQVPKAESLAVVPSVTSPIHFYVPETIYLTPNLSLATNFKYYVDSSNGTTPILDNSKEKTTGNIFFYCADASSVTITCTGASVTMGANTGTTTINTSITAGTLTEGVAQTETLTLTWIATYTVNGIQMTAKAHTVCYAPRVEPIGAAARTYNDDGLFASNKADLQGFAYMSGIQGYADGGLRTFNQSGTSVTPLLGVVTAPSGNQAFTDWLGGSSGGVNYGDWSGGDDTFTLVRNSPIGTLAVDTSRYTNINQVPNLTCGLVITNTNNMDQLNYYIANYDAGTTYLTNADYTSSGDQNNAFRDNGAQGVAYLGDATTNQGVSSGIKYGGQTGVNVYSAPLSGTGVYNMRLKAASWADNNNEWNCMVFNIGVTVTKFSKAALRAEIRHYINLGLQQTDYTPLKWATYLEAISNAATNLGNPSAGPVTSTIATAYAALVRAPLTATVKHIFSSGKTTEIETTGFLSGDSISIAPNTYEGYTIATADGISTLTAPQTLNKIIASGTQNYRYTANTYTVNYNINGGEGGSTAITSHTYNTAMDLRLNAFVKNGYTFAGWATSASGPVVYTNGENVINLTSTAGATVELYAIWKAILTFDVNNGTPVSPITVVQGTSVEKPTNPTRPGYSFNGWYYDILFSQAVSWPLVLIQSKTIYAKWTNVSNTVSFDSNGGTPVTAIGAITNTVVRQPTPPTREGYTFIGWYRDQGTLLNAVQWPYVMGTSSVTFYAKWTPNDITITFDSDGGTNVAALTALADSPISAPTAPEKFGYVFAGWTLNGAPYTFSTMPTLNITLVATWTIMDRAAQTDLKTYKKINDVFVPVTTARAGETVYVLLTEKTNFYCGSSKYVIMYDTSFYTILGSAKTAITPNTSNAYYSNVVSSYTGQTANQAANWPTTFTAEEKAKYMFVSATFTANATGFPAIISDSNYLFYIRLSVKAGATGSGHIFMDRRWDKTSTWTSTYASFFNYCPNATTPNSSGVSALDFNTDYRQANKTVTLDTSIPLITSISFNTEGGTAISAIVGEAGTAANQPANPVKEGYTFTGWLPAFPSPAVFPQTDLVITAQWQANTYNAKFMVDGIEYANRPTLFGALISSPANPVKVGYTFNGWSPAVSTMGAQDKIFTALFTINYYTAFFVVDDAPYDSVVTEYGAQIQAPADPQKTGYRFTGWTPAVGTMGAANQTYTAQFSINNYYAYFVVDGQTIATIPTQFGAQIVAPSDPSKIGYSFEGWTPVVGTMGAENQTFTAQWKAIVYDANFMVGNELYFKAVTIVGQTISRPLDPSKEGYTFTGWDNVPTVMPSNNVTITATWSINTYTTTFKVDGATYSTVQTVYGLPISLPTAPSKEGYTFNGWANLPATMPAQNLTLNAIFTANTYIATFTADNGYSVGVPTEFGKEIVAPANPTKTGYTFLGWLNVPPTMPAHDVTIQASFSINLNLARFFVDDVKYAEVITPYGAQIELPAAPDKGGFTFTGWDPVPSAMPDYYIEFNATFTRNIYKAIFMVDGVEYRVVNTGYGETINLPPIPSKAGYSFKQWNNLPAKMPDGDVTITGEWSVSSFDAVFWVDDVFYTAVPTYFGEKIKLPTAPTKSGSYFGGWDPFFTGTMPANNLEFHAKWVSEAYNAIFNVDDIWYDTVVTGLGAPVVAPANPTKPGYLFIGWDPGLSPAMPAFDITYNAIFIPSAAVTVQFNLNGGTGTVPADQTGAEGTAVIFPTRGDITKQDFFFFGWATSSTATTALANYTIPSANATLYAVWLKLGDVNFDKVVSVTDALWVLQAVSGVRILTDKEKAVADVLSGGGISTSDALRILQYVSGIVIHF